MFKKIIPIFTIICVMLAAGLVFAKPENKTVAIPKTAKQIGDGVYDLGKAIDKKSGEEVEGRAIVHYKKGDAGSNGKAFGAKATQCYVYLARGGYAKWKSVEPWVVNPLNTRGLDENSVYSNLTADILKWEDATDGILNKNIGFDILGDGSITADALVADTASPDGVNEVYFANVSSQGAIAITIVWGIFSGPSSNQKLVEWDQIYDDIDYDWSLSGELGKMDFENIATHELGHSVGLGDLYNSCVNETMYGYATEGEIKKRDLNSGDIIGINKLY